MSIISKRTIVALCIFILTLLPYATSAAFNPPGGTPPSGNVDPPLYSIGTETLTGNLIINSSSGTSLQGSGGTIGLQGSGSTYGVQGLLSSDGAAGGAGLYINSRNADNNGVAVPPIIDYAAYIYSNTGTFGIGLQSTAAIYGSGPGLDIFFMQRDSGLVWPRLSDGAMLYGVSVTSGGKLRVLGHGDGISFLDQEVKALVNIDETPGDPKLDLVNGTDLCFAGDCKVSWSDVVTDSGWTQNDSDLYPNSTGWHVGIGTTDPDELLEVKDGHIAQYHASSADTAGYRIKGFSDGGGTKTQLGIFGLRQNDESAAGGEFLIGLHDGSSVVDKFVIDKDGNVGIGTTAPGDTTPASPYSSTNATLLEIEGSANSTDVGLLLRSQGTTNGGADIWMDNNVARLYFDSRWNSDANSPIFSFRSDTSATAEEIFTMTASGNVGIGTTDPGAYRLAVSGGDVYNYQEVYATIFRDVTTPSSYYLDPHSSSFMNNASANNVVVAINLDSQGTITNTSENNNGRVYVNDDFQVVNDVYLTDNKSIRIDSGSDTTLLFGNYNDGAFAYGGTNDLNIAVEGDVQADRFCIDGNSPASNCKASWGDIAGDQTLLEVLRVGSDASAYGDSTLIGGKVGIGGSTTLASYSLYVTGNQYILGDLRLSGDVFVRESADLAEEFEANPETQAGTVMVMGDDGYRSAIPSSTEYDQSVIGVISDNAAVVMGSVEGPNRVIIALIGVVKVKVVTYNGIIKKGDLLTTSNIPGHAMKADEPKIGTNIGKALESFTGVQGEIMVLINLQ